MFTASESVEHELERGREQREIAELEAFATWVLDRHVAKSDEQLEPSPSSN